MKKGLLFLILISSLAISCGGRIPSKSKTSHLTKKHFNKYGKKYKETVYYKSPVTAVEVKDTKELQKNVATSFVLLRMTDGSEIPVILNSIRKFPLGWRITGWERIPQ